MFLSVIFILTLIQKSFSNECSDSCDLTYSGTPVVICGTDKVTHETFFDALRKNCYNLCGISTLYEGPCGCPNQCFESFKQGSCSAVSSSCVCAPGWGGADCSQPVKDNVCSLHGKLREKDDDKNDFPFDNCDCDDGWTGIDCSTQSLTVGNAPWGTLFDVKPYTDLDKYKDDHPVFNIAQMSTIRVELEESDFIYLLNPSNLYNESFVSATFHFDNGLEKETIENVGLRVKGGTTRIDTKKGFYIKFNEFVSGQKLFGLKKIGLKGGSVDDDSFIKQKLYSDFIRAIGGPVQRSSYALLYINGVYEGLYIMHEDVDSDFIPARIEDDSGEGVMFKMFYDVHLGYFGPDIQFYEDRAVVNPIGAVINYYQPQSDGNETYVDLVNWLEFFNTSTQASFEAKVEGAVDVDRLLRFLMVEAFVIAGDHMANGNNFYVYHRTTKEVSEQRLIFYCDFDELFSFNVSSDKFSYSPDVFRFFDTLQYDDYEVYNPLTEMLFATEKYMNSYVDNMQVFMDALFGSDSKQQPAERASALLQFVLPWVQKDRLWQLAYGVTPQQFVIDAENTISNLPWRYQNVTAQLREFHLKK